MNMIKRIVRKLFSEYRWLKNYKWGNLWNYKHGFLPATISVCKINKDNYAEFLNDRDYFAGHPWNGAYSGIIDNKLFLPMLLKAYPEYVPKYYYFKDESGFLPLFNTRGEGRDTVEVFLGLLSKEGKLCLKHTHSSVGQGFMLVEKIGNNYRLNGKIIELSRLTQIVNELDEYIICECVEGHEYSTKICPTSLNTIRFLCAWDYDKKEFFLARCFHRFGCNGNVVDNVGSGNGLLVFVDPETGKMKSNGAININNSGDRFIENIVHPDNNILLTGLEIPNFKEIKEKVLEICDSISFLRWVGLDVAVTKDGFKIIEINSLSSLVDQECEGYLKDERLRRLFKK